ncbi:hypothetical protein PF005_g22983 [Phytophthora fragariae]|uniref:Uncharacterized protein n=1 Tax=Phytophthora fragariae TaxID=53985 RepID=A0A6A4C3P1_9STRA|nr:hypothetical protein PF003_g29957 [Phytophthora fragariae]KAE8926047.1 hypothetical protein PF009_g23756 [Phytophthora fragariae]KAE8982119.1 hypothetical protein PF011_g21749 [Phytophthora fragariae]KAE9080251.1 hypothetical protein PF010_g22449 [Phytophthora fragariae]KAE9080491.1 hypothetical protein PF007_g23032 [Phytophthora fragariae]
MSKCKWSSAALVLASAWRSVAAELNVTVHLDATYAMESTRGPTCSGVGDLPTGAACPLKGDIAIADCHDKLPTFNGIDCVAPVTAVCVIDAESKWACVFPNSDESDVKEDDLTSTLTISSEFSSDKSPWGDLPWRAPPRVELVVTRPEIEDVLQTTALLQVK